MKEKWEKFKAWVKENPYKAAAILAAVVVAIYYIFFRGGVKTLGYSPEDSTTYPAGDGGGDGGEKEPGYDPEDIYKYIDEQNRGILGVLDDFWKIFSDVTQVWADSILQPYNDPPYYPTEQVGIYTDASGVPYYSAPVSDLIGGTGGGMMIGTYEQLQEFYAGGSRNMGGSYSLDMAGWLPTGAQQLNTQYDAINLAAKQMAAAEVTHRASSGSGSNQSSPTYTPYTNTVTPLTSQQISSMSSTAQSLAAKPGNVAVSFSDGSKFVGSAGQAATFASGSSKQTGGSFSFSGK